MSEEEIVTETVAPTPDFKVYANGLCYASVCTSLTPEAATERINRENPTGVSSQWALHNGPFRTGEPNPTPCETFPETHKHYLFVC